MFLKVLSVLAESGRRWQAWCCSRDCTEVSAFPWERGSGIRRTRCLVWLVSQLQNAVRGVCEVLFLYPISTVWIQEC